MTKQQQQQNKGDDIHCGEAANNPCVHFALYFKRQFTLHHSYCFKDKTRDKI